MDNRRLGKQRVETFQIMRALLTGQGWVNHPATLMWKGHELTLLAYQQAVCNEWINGRGFADSCWNKTRLLYLEERGPDIRPMIPPVWLGNPDFHISHQSNLLRKDEEHYRPWFPGIRNDHEYVWPSRATP